MFSDSENPATHTSKQRAVPGALELAQVAEQPGDLAGVVFVECVQAHQRIEDQQGGLVGRNGVEQAALIGGKIQAQRAGGDDVERERGEIEAAVAAERGQALFAGGRAVLGHVAQHRPWVVYGEAAERGSGAGHRERQVEGEIGLVGVWGVWRARAGRPVSDNAYRSINARRVAPRPGAAATRRMCAARQRWRTTECAWLDSRRRQRRSVCSGTTTTPIARPSACSNTAQLRHSQRATSRGRIYTAGGIASRFNFTVMADAMARIVLTNALFAGRSKPSSLQPAIDDCGGIGIFARQDAALCFEQGDPSC